MIDYNHAKVKSKHELKKYITKYIKALDIEKIKSNDDTYLVIPYFNLDLTIELIAMMRKELKKLGILNKVTIGIAKDVKKAHQDMLSTMYGYK